MQDDFDVIVNRRKPPVVSRPQEDEDEFGAIVNRRAAAPMTSTPKVRPPLWERIKATGRAIADDPMGAAKSVGKGLATNAIDLAHLAQGDFQYVAREMADEFAKGPGAEGRLIARGVGAASLMVPAARVGRAATSALVNTAANAGLGAAQTPDDPWLGAVLAMAGKTVGKVTGATARAARRRLTPSMNLDGVTDDLGRGLDEAQRNAIPKRRTARTLKETVPLEEIGGEDVINKILAERTPRQMAALDASLVQPRPNPLAPVADTPIPETFLAELDGPRREVVAVPGGKKALVDPEVRADRVAGERFDVAEQRAAESQMVKEVKEIDKAKADAEAQVIKDAEKAAKQAEKAKKQAERDAAALDKDAATAKANALKEANALAARADKAAAAAAKAAELKALTDAKEAAKAAGTLKEFSAQQKAARTRAIADDAARKAEEASVLAAEAKVKMEDAIALQSASVETAAGMLGRAKSGFAEGQRFKNAARSALARRRGVQVEPVAADTPVAPSISQPIPEVTPAPVAPAQGILEPPVAPVVAAAAPEAPPITSPSGLPTAEKPFLNWRTLGVDPAKPDALNMSAAARVQAAATRPEMVERLAAERGRTTFAAMNAEAQKSWAIQQLGIDPLAVDSKKLVGLSGAQIHALKAPLMENAGLMESIAKEMQDLDGDDLVRATEVFERLEKSNDELLATIQREGSARGRDLGALRQMANMTTDPAVWLLKAKKVLGDTPMTASVQARIMKLAKEAAEACGGA